MLRCLDQHCDCHRHYAQYWLPDRSSQLREPQTVPSSVGGRSASSPVNFAPMGTGPDGVIGPLGSRRFGSKSILGAALLELLW